MSRPSRVAAMRPFYLPPPCVPNDMPCMSMVEILPGCGAVTTHSTCSRCQTQPHGLCAMQRCAVIVHAQAFHCARYYLCGGATSLGLHQYGECRRTTDSAAWMCERLIVPVITKRTAKRRTAVRQSTCSCTYCCLHTTANNATKTAAPSCIFPFGYKTSHPRQIHAIASVPLLLLLPLGNPAS